MLSRGSRVYGLGGLGGVAVGGLRIVAVGLEQHFLLREIRDDHAVVVAEVLQVIELDDMRAVGQHLLLADRLDDRLLARASAPCPG